MRYVERRIEAKPPGAAEIITDSVSLVQATPESRVEVVAQPVAEDIEC